MLRCARSHVRPHTSRSTPIRDKPNRPERTRMFADKTIGVDDPSMIALQRMVDAVCARVCQAQLTPPVLAVALAFPCGECRHSKHVDPPVASVIRGEWLARSAVDGSVTSHRRGTHESADAQGAG